MISSEERLFALEEADIGLYVTDQLQSQFYDVLVDDQESPYLNVENILSDWLGFKVSCNVEALICTAQLPPTLLLANLDGQKGIARYEGHQIELPKGALIQQQGKLWLKYDIWSKWLPMSVHWSLKEFQLTLIPHFRLPSEWLTDQKHRADAALTNEKEKQRKPNLRMLHPSGKISAESRYQLDWAIDQQARSALGVATESNVDIGGGTFYLSANEGYEAIQSEGRDIYWNYSFSKPGFFNLLRLGDTETPNTLLLPYLELTKAIQFNRLPPNQGSGNGFVYVGYTMPGIEVDVYRNGVLLLTQISSSDGSYWINMPETVAGDRFTVQFYFKDGTYKEKEWVIANDYGLILKSGQQDVQMLTGELSTASHPRVNHFAWRVGLMPHVTLGLHLLRLPKSTNESADAGLLDGEWEVTRWLFLMAEGMHTETNDDYVFQTDMTALPNHDWRFSLTQISDQSPIVYLQNQSEFADVRPFASNHSWSLKDIWSVKTWRMTSAWIDDRDENTLNFNASGQLSEALSSINELGHSWSKIEGTQDDSYLTVGLNYLLVKGQLLSVSRLMSADATANNTLNYRLQGNGRYQYDASVGVNLPDKGGVNFSGSFAWRSRQHWRIGLNVDNQSINLVLTFQGIFGEDWHYRSYRDFGSGSVEGYVRAPPEKRGQKSQAVPHAEIEVGGVSTITDENGHYFLSGIDTHEPVRLNINAKSLDAELAPVDPSVMVLLRPGTVIHYNPKLEWVGGIDGYLSRSQRDKGNVIKIVDLNSHHLISQVTAEQDGFFSIDGLPLGRYELVVADKDHEEIAHHVVRLSGENNWISNLVIKDDPLRLADNKNAHAFQTS